MSNLHTWSALWNEYPDYWNMPDSKEVKKDVFGATNSDWITNTCAVRLSRTLNYNGFPIPGNFAGLVTVKGADGKRYALRVREMRKWLDHALGKPDFDITKKKGAPFQKSVLAILKGIIAFDIQFTDATGHMDLWDGSVFSSEWNTSIDYWKAATRITLWVAKV